VDHGARATRSLVVSDPPKIGSNFVDESAIDAISPGLAASRNRLRIS
jgi:hypothetical protein